MLKTLALLLLAAAPARAADLMRTQDLPATAAVTASTSWTFTNANGIKAVRFDGSIDFSTITAALNSKLSSGAIPSGFVDFSTLTAALNTKMSSPIPSGFIDFSTITTALATKQASFVGITSSCSAGFYLGAASWANGVANGGSCTADATGGTSNTVTSSFTITDGSLKLGGVAITTTNAGIQTTSMTLSITGAAVYALTLGTGAKITGGGLLNLAAASGILWPDNKITTTGFSGQWGTGGSGGSSQMQSSGTWSFISSQAVSAAASGSIGFDSTPSSQAYCFRLNALNNGAGARQGYFRFNGDSTAGNHHWSTQSQWDTNAGQENFGGATSATEARFTEAGNTLDIAAFMRAFICFESIYGTPNTVEFEGYGTAKFSGFDIRAKERVYGNYIGSAPLSLLTVGVTAGTFTGVIEMFKFTKGAAW